MNAREWFWIFRRIFPTSDARSPFCAVGTGPRVAPCCGLTRSEPGSHTLRGASRGRGFRCCVGIARVSVRRQDGPWSGLRPAALTDQDTRPDRLEQLGLWLGPTEMVRGGETRPFTRGRPAPTPGSASARRARVGDSGLPIRAPVVGEREWGRYQGGSGGF